MSCIIEESKPSEYTNDLCIYLEDDERFVYTYDDVNYIIGMYEELTGDDNNAYANYDDDAIYKVFLHVKQTLQHLTLDDVSRIIKTDYVN